MNAPRLRNRLKRKLRQGKTTLGLWVTLEAPSITEIATDLGLDWIVIDAEHGHLDLKEIVEHLRAARNTRTTALVRIQEIEQGLIKRVLDIGAEGILVPQVRDAEEVAQAVRFAKYPPKGVRGIGAERSTRWGSQLKPLVRAANRETLVIPLIENVEAERNMDSILEVPGVDAIFFGPADFSASAGYLGEWEGTGIAQRILAIHRKARARGIPTGVVATGAGDGKMRRRQGFQMIGIGLDAPLLMRAVREMIGALRA
jgi:2-keto-3-deoxy-L-rhamnonate aldolase RhmA